LLIGGSACPVCFGQAPANDAAAKLQAKQAERNAQRSKLVQVTAGELEDLREQVRTLKAQNAELLRKLNEMSSSASASASKASATKGPAQKKKYTQIEVGMTREEVDAFIKSRKDFKLIGVSQNSGITKHAEEMTVRRQGTSASDRVVNGSRTEAQEASGSEEKRTIERKIDSGRKETITVAHLGTRQVQTGSQRNALGRSTPVYGSEWYEDGRLTIEMVDDVVTAVSGRQY
jgi:hypothetical protein